MIRSLFLLALFIAINNQLLAKSIVVDTFDAGDGKNLLGGSSDVWGDKSDPSIGVKIFFDPEIHLGEEGNSLRLDYDIESNRENVFVPQDYSVSRPVEIRDDIYNGYYSQFSPINLRFHKFLILWVKGDQEKGLTRSIRVELKDDKVASGVLLESVSNEWQEFVIPLNRFREIRDFSKIKEVGIVFGPRFVTRKVGRVYIDDIYFAKSLNERIRPPNRRIKSPHWTSPPLIDGYLKEWPKKNLVKMTSKKEFKESGGISSRRDLSVLFSSSWDKNFLYFSVVVRDNEIINQEDLENIWKQDCIEIYIDPRDDGFVWGAKDDFQIGVSPSSKEGPPAVYSWFQKRVPGEDEVHYQFKRRKGSYQVEMGIAWKFLKIVPSPDRSIGFSLAVHDYDELDRTKKGKFNWNYYPLEGSVIGLGKLILER